MGRVYYYVDKADHKSVESLITAFGARGTHHEGEIRAALSLHQQPFIVFMDYVNRPEVSILDDAFAYNPVTGEMALYSDEIPALVEAIIDLALLLNGFETLTRSNEEWEPHVALGARRHVRQTLRSQLRLDSESAWHISLEVQTIEAYNIPTFMSLIYFASRPNVDILFPNHSSAMAIHAFQRLARIMETVAIGIKLTDAEKFNRRLRRAVQWILQDIAPATDISPFDDLFSENGFNERFFEDDPGSVMA